VTNTVNIDQDCADTVCIVGAGPGGLSMARALRALKVPYHQYERHYDVGGIWDIRNPGTPMYQSAHFISSRELSGFIGYPMPAHWPDYPSHQHIHGYVRGFADAFGLRPAIRFGVGIASVQPEPAGTFIVTLSNGRRHRYGAVVCATGVTWDPSTPRFPGAFRGELRHVNTYKTPAELREKRVLVVGAGNSGVDIASDAASHAAAAFISMRRGYHIMPKHILGVPTDVYGEQGTWLPLWLKRLVFRFILAVVRGNPTRWGFPAPNHALFETHPLLNTQILHHAQHGNLTVKPDIARLDGNHVEFVDGSREEIDLVLCATGYNWSIPYARDCFTWSHGRPDLYLSMFHRQTPNLFCIGYLETNSSAYKLFDTQAWTIARYLSAQRSDPKSAARFAELMRTDQPDLSGGIRFVDSPRHAVYVDSVTYKAYLQRLRARLGWGDPTPAAYGAIAARPLPQPTFAEPRALETRKVVAHEC
jgi:Flavin-binding monooxygenase-like